MSDNILTNDDMYKAPDFIGESDSEERLVTDDRGNLSPAEMIERKLGYLLKNGSLPVSHVRVGRRNIRAR